MGTKPKIITVKKNIAAINGENNAKIVVGGNLTTIAGTAVEIYCLVEAFPAPSISWLYNGSPAPHLIIKEGSYISFSLGVAVGDSGFYTCVANNSLGSDTQTTYMSVIGKYHTKSTHLSIARGGNFVMLELLLERVHFQ